jgi:predicted NAD-dependent protein-ADP-ribosyltransferase YbiA (DUF1768 family)
MTPAEEALRENLWTTAVIETKCQSTILFKAKVNNNFSFLSNFYPHVRNFSPAQPQPSHRTYLFESDDVKFNSVEQHYQYHKFLVIDPAYAKDQIMTATTAVEVKRRSGKGVYVAYTHSRSTHRVTKASLNVKFDKLKTEFFEESALSVMRRGLFLKFDQNPRLKEALLATGDRKLSEIGRMKREYWAHTGEDMLGKLLMEHRQSLRV